MTYQELVEKVSLQFPQKDKENAEHYEFFIDESLSPFKGRTELSNVWEQIRLYEGQKNRPDFSFFYKIAAGIGPDSKDFVYFSCRCGGKMNFKSEGGCVECHQAKDTTLRRSKTPIEGVTPAQSGCFDCSIYGDSETVFGPTCNEFGTPGYDNCQMKNQCRCSHCCRFEYYRRYHPLSLRENLDKMTKALPAPLSEAGKAFQDGRATAVDINKMLKWKESGRSRR